MSSNATADTAAGPRILAFLHTARPNIQLFADLIGRLAPDLPVRHEMLDEVLKDAVGSGAVTTSMRQQTEAAVQRIARDEAAVVVCTCSTIGGVAESTPVPPHARVMRIDRPMAEAAVETGRRIMIVATLPSTLAPTRALVQQVATEMGRTPELVDVLCENAWHHFQRGDTAAYAEEIARVIRGAARPDDVVVLAQASMAPAATLLNAAGPHHQNAVRVLASPELGVRAAINLYRRMAEGDPGVNHEASTERKGLSTASGETDAVS